MADPNIWSPAGDTSLVRESVEFFKGTSGTSHTITSTPPNLTFQTQPYLYFDEGAWIVIVDNDNLDNWMSGQVVDYNPTTGILIFLPRVSQGSGTISDWLIYLSGVHIPQQWTGGVVSTDTTFEGEVVFEGEVEFTEPVSITGGLDVIGTIKSKSGNLNLSRNITFPDGNVSLSAEDIFNNTIILNPSVNYNVVLPPAASILTLLEGEEVGSNFDFSIVNLAESAVLTVQGNSGVIQIGNTLLTQGSARFKVTVQSATIVEIACIAWTEQIAGANVIDSSVVQTISSDSTLNNSSPRLMQLTFASTGLSLILPPANTMQIASPVYQIENVGYYSGIIKDNSGRKLIMLDGGGSITISLVNNTGIAGVWSITGKGTNGLAYNWNALLPNTLVTPILPYTVTLTPTLTAHFAYAASTVQTFVIDHTSKTVGAPVVASSVVTTTRLIEAFKISDSSYIIFYTNATATGNIYGVVITVAGTVCTVGTSSTMSCGTMYPDLVTPQGGINAVKLVQLDTNLFFVYPPASGSSYATAAFVTGTSVSFCAIVFIGSNVSFAGISYNSMSVTRLTNTTALCLFKTGSASPFAGQARVVTVTPTTPPTITVGTLATTFPAAYVLQAAGSTCYATSYVELTPTRFIMVDGYSSDLSIMGIEVAGTTIGVTALIPTGATVSSGQGFVQDNWASTRFNRHLVKINDTTVFMWGTQDGTNGDSICQAFTVNYPAITPGPMLRNSFSSGTNYYGTIAIVSGDVAIGVQNVNNSGDVALIPHKITGNNISVGVTTHVNLGSGSNFSITSDYVSGFALPNGIFVLQVSTVTVSARKGIITFKSDGNFIKIIGILDTYNNNFSSGLYKGHALLPTNQILTVESTPIRVGTATSAPAQIRLSVLDYVDV